MNRPRRPRSRVSSRSAMARNAAWAAGRSPLSCADCACSSSASGSLPACLRAMSACARALIASPWPIASNPWVMAWRPRAWRFSRRPWRIFSGIFHSARKPLHSRIAATMTTPSKSTNTGSEGLARQHAPGQHDFAGLVGHPRRTGGRERDQQQKQNDPMHQNPIEPVFY